MRGKGENNIFIVSPKLFQREMNKERGNAVVISQVLGGKSDIGIMNNLCEEPQKKKEFET